MKSTQRSQRRRSGKTGTSVSLFPFLAVLICMMGALVPLLLVISRTARLQAEAGARAKFAERIVQQNSELQTRREDVQWRIEQLKSAGHATEAELADARLELGHLEDHSRRLREQLKRHENTIAEIERLENADSGQRAQTQAEIRRIRAEIETAKNQLGDVAKIAAQQNRSYAVVPYEGPNQTRRRPIYIECREEAVVLQPEGIALVDDDFEGPLGPGNPLAASLRAMREYLQSQSRLDPQAGEPYPMLLVRPSGIAAYYAARAAMKSWGSDFGYELIGDDWKLAYQSPDPQLAAVVRQTLVSARATQARLIAAAPRQYPNRKTYRASNNGGFVPDGEEPGTGGGGRGTGGGYNPYVAAAERPAPAVPAGGVYGSAVGTDSSSLVNNNNENSRGPTARGSSGAVASGGGYGNAYGSVAGDSGVGDIAENSSNSQGPTIRGAGGENLAQNVSENSSNSRGPTARGSSGENREETGNRYVTGAEPRAVGPRLSRDASDTSRTPQSAERPEGYVVGQPGREQPQIKPTDAANDPALAEASRGHALRPGEWEPTPDPLPKPPKEDKNDSFDKNKEKKRPPASLAERRGEDWGLRDAARGSVGVTRPIRVECYADRLVIRADRNPADDKAIPFGPRTVTSIDLFVSATWEHMERWGIAGRGMYWRPVLHVSVAPGAEQRFVEFSALLEGSGLAIVRKQ